MKQQLLLLQDVDALGKKGEIVSAKPGYIRNFLLPKKLAVVATANMLKKQETLRKERAEQAIFDKREAEELADKIRPQVLETKVKVDPEGRMYGSVSALDIVKLFEEKGLAVDKKCVQVTKPIKETGKHSILLKLKEGVEVTCELHILPEGVSREEGREEVTAPIETEDMEEKEKGSE